MWFSSACGFLPTGPTHHARDENIHYSRRGDAHGLALPQLRFVQCIQRTHGCEYSRLRLGEVAFSICLLSGHLVLNDCHLVGLNVGIFRLSSNSLPFCPDLALRYGVLSETEWCVDDVNKKRVSD